jgi:hypothetical protein
VRGDVTWNGTCLPEGKGIPLQHLLLEHARRSDELPRILRRLGETAQLAVPLSEPPAKPTMPPRQRGRVDDGWDFFDDPDPAALAEWSDARLVWPLCDGQHSLEEIVELALLGRFRGLAALAALHDRNHLTLVDAAPVGVVELGEGEIGELARALPSEPATVLRLRPLAAARTRVPPPEEQPTEYSVVLRVPRPSPPSPASERPTPRRPPPPVLRSIAQPKARSRDVIDDMLADLITPSPDDEPAFVELPPASLPAAGPTPIDRRPRRSKALAVVAMAVAGAALFVAGAGVALHVSRTTAPVVDR